jgi:hypothetical protein
MEETRAELGRNGPGPAGLAHRRSPFWARFDAPFDLAASQAIYSPLAESHVKRHPPSAAEEQRRGHHLREERVEMVD